jgi:hypothetical protein
MSVSKEGAAQERDHTALDVLYRHCNMKDTKPLTERDYLNFRNTIRFCLNLEPLDRARGPANEGAAKTHPKTAKKEWAFPTEKKP